MKTTLRFASLASLCSLLALVACTRTASLDLTLVEPCDQKAQSLNGVSNFRVSSSGSTADDVVEFSADSGTQTLPVGLGLPVEGTDNRTPVILTVEAFENDVAGAPKSIGRTAPLALTENVGDQKLLVEVGLTNSFGRTSDAAGECTTLTDGDPVKGRHGHTATFVPGLNQVLIVGGAVWQDGEETLLDTAELWDPSTGTFEKLPRIEARAYHAASALSDGRVLITGGFGVARVGNENQLTTLVTSLLFDPKTKTFGTLRLHVARAHHTSTLIPAANLVVIYGGCTGRTLADGCTPTAAGPGNAGDSTDMASPIEVFDPGTGTLNAVSAVSSPGTIPGRAFHQATVLENGANSLLVITGGANAAGPVCDLEIYKANGSTLSPADVTPLVTFPATKCPVRHQAIAVNETSLVVIGGQTSAPSGEPSGGGSADVWTFNSASGIDQVPLGTMTTARAGHLAARLKSGAIVVVGGAGTGAAAAEILTPVATGGLEKLGLTSPAVSRDRAALAVLPNNQMLLTGGYSTTPPFTTTDAAELFFGP